ncbi:MAG TPA: 4Fe-4S binding protein [Thermodesulfovibrionales bacterium]|nr:4Fe-4S binding protein [Thermodesulfovibrionales bacterium]
MIPYIDYSKCNGCEACAEIHPVFFIIRDEKAWVINYDKFVFEDHKIVIYCCPFSAITIE